jgi:UDP-glucose 6-dehydrogenase
MDNRIGGGHSIVPSPDDGMLGFGGHCLPKDLVAISEIDTLGLFKKISDINNHLRK